VKAVGAAKALAWERETAVDRAYVEYPRHGVIRSVSLSTRNKAAYRRTLRAVRSMDGPPPRVDDDSKCDSCRFAEQCGVRTRSLKSLLTG
jgi:CRISPR-associated exonuclease Cas4